MTWVKLDDGFSEHPKVEALSAEALRLHIFGLCYCNRNETDGFITEARPRLLVQRYRSALTAELVTAGLWDLAEGGWTIHDYLLFNPSKAQLTEKREKAVERMRNVRTNTKRTSPARSHELRPTPSRPDPKGLGTESVFTSGLDGSPALAGGEPPVDTSLSVEQVRLNVESVRSLRAGLHAVKDEVA